MKILLIDKSELVRDYFKSKLELLEHDVFETHSIDVANFQLKKNHCDLILCGATNITGDVLKFIIDVRKNFGNSMTIYIMSSYSPYPVSVYFEAGANDFLVKSDNLIEIVDKIHSISIKNSSNLDTTL